MKNKLWVKILIPVLIVAVIGGMWIIKTVTNKDNEPPAISQNSAELPENLKDADFSLRETEEIDFEALSA